MTNRTAFSTVVAVSKLLATMLALAVLPATAPPARGDPPVTEGAGGGTGAGGGVDPPGGITDAPPPEVPNTDASWTATVGGTEFAGLTEADVGRVLWRGERVSVTYEDADGMVRTARVCEGFPEVALTAATSDSEAVSRTASVALDFERCAVKLVNFADRIPHESIYAPLILDHQGSLVGRAFVPNSVPIVSLPYGPVNRNTVQNLPTCPSSPSSPVRATELRGRMRGGSGWGVALTEAMLWRCYGTETMVTTYRRSDCDTESPGFIVGVYWIEDECRGTADFTYAGHARATTTGDFHAWRWVPWNERWHHAISLSLVGNQHFETRTCVISPETILDISLLLLEVRFDCDYDTRVR